MQRLISLFGFLVLGAFGAACAQLPFSPRSAAPEAAIDIAVQQPDSDTTRPAPRPGRGAVQALGRTGMAADILDMTSPEERSAALQAPAARTQLLGETLASLGGVGEPGLWLRTGLVSQTQQGRVELQQGSGSLRVELRPSGAPAGSGSQLSLAAFRSLNLQLTELVPLRVFAE